MSDLAALTEALRGLLGPGVGVAATDPTAAAGALYPGEDAAVTRAVPRRRLEFAAGRQAARLAMADIGLPPAPVPQGPDRAPVWPEGLVGSIAHCSTACIAAVAPRTHLRAIGIDIEDATPLEAELEGTICTRSERAWLDRQPARDRALLAKLIFSAKEAVYKARYPLTGEMIGFDAVEITASTSTGGFSIAFPGGLARFPGHAPPDGRWQIVGNLLVCGLILPD